MSIITTNARGLAADATNMVLLNSSDFTSSGVNTITFDNTLITDTYDVYRLILTRINGSDDYNLAFQVSDDNGSSYHTGTSYKRAVFAGHHGKTDDTISTRYNAFSRGYIIGNTFTVGGVDKETSSGTFDFHNLRRSDLGKICTGIAGFETNGERGCLEVVNIYLDLDLVVNNLKIITDTGTVTGKAALYGVKV
tara:strand:- start:898 stop:1479 length:582 start_codon:yes stop_codon:yes gene_type:complete